MNNATIFSTIVLTIILLLPAEKLQARYVNVDAGRFQTMDTSGGNNGDPLSLHKYLYAECDPVDNEDPSGHDIGSLAETLTVVDIAVLIESLAIGYLVIHTAEQPFRDWTIYQGLDITIFHSYVVAENQENVTYRYEITLDPETQALAWKHHFTTYQATLKERNLDPALAFTGFTTRVCKLSDLTFVWLNQSIIGIAYPQPYLREDRDYILARKNCITYATAWSLNASAFSLLPF